MVAKLRSYHNAAQNASAGDPKKVLSRYGLDLLNGEVRDNVKAGVLEPAVSKVRSLKSAFEAADFSVSALLDDAGFVVVDWILEPRPGSESSARMLRSKVDCRSQTSLRIKCWCSSS